MLKKIKSITLGIIGLIFMLVFSYFTGKQKGVSDEKIKNLENSRKNTVAANRMRSKLYDSGFTDRLHKKYRRL
jgi:hypothetical protein